MFLCHDSYRVYNIIGDSSPPSKKFRKEISTNVLRIQHNKGCVFLELLWNPTLNLYVTRLIGYCIHGLNKFDILHICLAVTLGSYHRINGLMIKTCLQQFNPCHSYLRHFFHWNSSCNIFNYYLGGIIIAPGRYMSLHFSIIVWHSVFSWHQFIGYNCTTGCHAISILKIKRISLTARVM